MDSRTLILASSLLAVLLVTAPAASAMEVSHDAATLEEAVAVLDEADLGPLDQTLRDGAAYDPQVGGVIVCALLIAKLSSAGLGSVAVKLTELCLKYGITVLGSCTAAINLAKNWRTKLLIGCLCGLAL